MIDSLREATCLPDTHLQPLDAQELASLQGVAAILLGRTNAELDLLVAADELEEICDGEEA